MPAWRTWVRRALLAALSLFPIQTWAEVSAQLDHATGSVVVTGLGRDAVAAALANPDTLRLRVEDSPSERGMLLTLKPDGYALRVMPRFSLLPGRRYALEFMGEKHLVALPAPKPATPRLTRFAPSQAVIPANTLRLYIQFSEPMARGQLRESVSLVMDDGTSIISPFLTLEQELWNPTQTRATLMLDPGRIKQGVGPNVSDGAPLQDGKSYRLTIAEDMRSAEGVPLGEPASVIIRVGPPERRAIVPDEWEVQPPMARGQAPLNITFDRIMDSRAVLRLIELRGPEGDRVTGRVTTDGGGWSLIPTQPWRAGRYSLTVDPDLEDVAGNTIGVPFDAAPGAMGSKIEPVILTFEVSTNSKDH